MRGSVASDSHGFGFYNTSAMKKLVMVNKFKYLVNEEEEGVVVLISDETI